MNKMSRSEYLAIAFAEMIGIAIILAMIIQLVFGGGIIMCIITFMVWALIVGCTPLLNRFLVIIPKNSGAVIVNSFRTYEMATPVGNKLTPTDALREVGPGLQGVLLWEKVGWIIDLGKQIKIGTPIKALTKDNIELTVEWQVILTPLRTYLCNLVRHDKDTVEKFFEGKCRAKITEIISREYAQNYDADPTTGTPAIKSLYSRINSLKSRFNGLFGGADIISDEEKQYGSFTNDPQITSIDRSEAFKKSVEARENMKNNTIAARDMSKKMPGLTDKVATMAVLKSQNINTDGMEDITIGVDVSGLPAGLRDVNIMGVPVKGNKKPSK